MDDDAMWHEALAPLFADDDRPAVERDRLVTLMVLFATLPVPDDPFGMYPEYAELKRRFVELVERAGMAAAGTGPSVGMTRPVPAQPRGSRGGSPGGTRSYMLNNNNELRGLLFPRAAGAGFAVPPLARGPAAPAGAGPAVPPGESASPPPDDPPPTADAIEEAFLTLYAHVHGYEAPYTPDERRRMDELGGYWCHAGGLSPILKAGEFITPDTVSADYGAGNGLQGLLMQKLYPHAKTIQIELSSRMVAAGRVLQRWLGIGDDRVEWVIGDIMDRPPREIDFIYMYRPVKPEGEGRRFYEMMARELARADRRVVVFSIADCFREFAGPEFAVFYRDGHLTCMINDHRSRAVGRR